MPLMVEVCKLLAEAGRIPFLLTNLWILASACLARLMHRRLLSSRVSAESSHALSHLVASLLVPYADRPPPFLPFLAALQEQGLRFACLEAHSVVFSPPEASFRAPFQFGNQIGHVRYSPSITQTFFVRVYVTSTMRSVYGQAPLCTKNIQQAIIPD